jgi:hypothetical protein
MYKLIGADGKEYGPVTAEMVRQWIAEGRANALTKVLPENATEWKVLRDLPEFASAFPPASTAAPAPIAPVPSAFPEQGKTNPLAITGMILGITSITVGLCCCSGLPFSIPGLICSLIALSQLKQNPQQVGRGMAITGLVLSLCGLLAGVLIIVFYGLANMPDMMRRIRHL